jgi:pSer/pThr/pTyr-binding forkhead associated (FHA) protein
MLQLRLKQSSKAPVWLVAPSYTLGSSHECDCQIAQEGVAPVHAEIHVKGEAVTLVPVNPDLLLTLNGEPVTLETPLKLGDEIVMGSAELELIDPKLMERPKVQEATQMRSALSLSALEEASPWSLRPLNTTLTEKPLYPLFGAMLLGRSKECDISIGASHLSRKHAKFTVTTRGLTVEDLGSSNGTYVNGSRVALICDLKHGDEVSFDTLKFRVESKQLVEDVTSLRPALDETQIRQAVVLPPRAAAERKAPASRPKSPSRAATPKQAPEAPDGHNLAENGLFIGAIVLLVAAIVGFAWFVLS